ncbi:MAG: hypothetical protein NG747_13315 [Candidatus Brocadia sp.]|nr:hypothetical protein [Candidatus Brocadia sp.]
MKKRIAWGIGILAFMAISFQVQAVAYAQTYKMAAISGSKQMSFGAITLTSGSGTAAHGLSGTPTAAIFTPDYGSTGTTTTTFRVKVDSSNITVYGYSIATGATSTADFTGYWIAGK